MPRAPMPEGSVFGRWTITGLGRRGPSPSNRGLFFQCRCDCGVERLVSGSILRAGESRSCGCLKDEIHTRHGHAKKRNQSPTYKTWSAMMDRCLNKDSRNWDDYGGRGITVCDRWRDFKNFLADMGPRPDGLEIDRFPDNDGNYEPGNCRWTDDYGQANNRRNNRRIGGKTFAQHSRALGADPNLVGKRLARGISEEDAIKPKWWPKKITFNGQTHTVRKWADKIGVTYNALQLRLWRGLPLSRALKGPKS